MIGTKQKEPEDIAGVGDVDLAGTTVLVTGSTNGLGREAAVALGRLGADVVVHGRDEDAGRSAVSAIETTRGSAEFVSADFADVEDVSRLADTVATSVGELDVLCNNAGGLFEDNSPTELGVERTFHINHLSHYQLTAELLEAGALASDARVVTTSSLAHRLASLNLDKLVEMTPISPWAAYCRSKLANLRFSNELARRFDAAGQDRTANALHPGIIPDSEFNFGLPGPTEQLGSLLGRVPMTDSPEDGAATIVYLAAAESVDDENGNYYFRCRQRHADPAARDLTAQRELWERSAALLDIDEPLAGL